MLARSSAIQFRGSRLLRSPLFIPSFSSHGFEKRLDYSEVKELYQFASPHLGDVSLVSAYDLYHRNITWEDLTTYHSELVFIDSGGYEAVNGNTWSNENHIATLKERPQAIPCIYVSYDAPLLNEEFLLQINRSKDLQQQFPDTDIDFLIRAESKNSVIDIGAIKPNVNLLNSFPIVGVTEKDLGASIQDRMVAIASLRRLLDEASIKSPIHIFGSLSPVTSILYFLMGAEIFDGLSWLRNHFREDSVHHLTENYEDLADISISHGDLRKKRMLSNLSFIEALSGRAQQFCASSDWNALPYGDFCRDVLISIGEAI